MNDSTTQQERPTRRKVAEWVTLCASILLIASVAGYLVYDLLRPQRPTVPVEVRVLTDQARAEGDLYVVPMEVHNRGSRTLSDLKVLVNWQSRGGGETKRQDVTIQYLGEGASTKAYLYFDQHPRELHINAQPFGYQLQ